MHIGVQHVALKQVLVVFGISTPRAMIDEFKALADLASYGEIPTFLLSEPDILEGIQPILRAGLVSQAAPVFFVTQ